MISPKKLIKMARKWHKVITWRKMRISFPHENGNEEPSTSYVAEKGHFVFYTFDQKRFSFPIKYLQNSIIKELFRISEEVYGLPIDGPIPLPCNAVFMHYVVSIIQRSTSAQMEKSLLMSIASGSCSSSCSYHQKQREEQWLVSSC